MTKDKEVKPYPYPKEATPEQVGEMAKKFEEMRQMSGSDGRYDKPKPNKKVMEPIEIPEILSVPRPRDWSKLLRHEPMKILDKHYITPETPVGLSRRFTQGKVREGQILKELDKEMATERNRKNTHKTNEGGAK